MTATAPRRNPASRPRLSLSTAATHVILLLAAAIALAPTLLIILNSFKDRVDVFTAPYQPPIWFTAEPELGLVNIATLEGYAQVFDRAPVASYMLNSLIVTVGSLALIVVLGVMVSHALVEYRFRGNRLIFLYLIVGIMIPIRLGTVSLIKILLSLGLYDSLAGLILVYTASGIPLAVIILTTAMRAVPSELKDAARIDGTSEYGLLRRIIAPLLRPAIATVLIFNVILIWNDLWFPLTLAPSEGVRTITLGVSAFVGQYRTDWTVLLASLTLAALPALLIYLVFSRQIVKGLMSGAVKR
jgi:raffinose/stachyose/melibiose transport system permease protein